MTQESADDNRFQTCTFCGGRLEEQCITYTTAYQGRIVVVENVPALVCTQCGETAFRPDVVERLQQFVWGKVPSSSRPIAAESYDFAQVA